MKPSFRFRFLGKKRGDRRTGSRVLGSLGEAIFFGTLFLLGTISLTAIVTSQVLEPTPELYRPGFGFWLAILVLSSLVLIGGVGVFLSVTHVGASVERRSAMVRRAANIDLIREAWPSPHEYPTLPRDARLTDSPGVSLKYRLPARRQPVWKLATMAFLCLLLSGFASVFSVVFVESLLSGQPHWLIFMVTLPVLVGSVLAVRSFLSEIWQASRVGPTYVEISAMPLYPGGEYRIVVSQTGRFSLKSIALDLVCEEEATYHQGTDVRTESRIVYRQSLIRRENIELDPGQPWTALAELSLPLNVSHSFQSPHNIVRWKLVVLGEPETGRPFDRHFPVIIYPSRNVTKHPAANRQLDGRKVDHGTADQPANIER